MDLSGKTAFITGASRGIGLCIAKKLASQGMNIAIAAKTATPHRILKGTIYTAAEEIEAAGGKALPLVVDVREEKLVQEGINKTVEEFGGLDIVINNASAIQLTGTLETTMKRFDLMTSVNYRGTFLVSKTAIPHLKNSEHAHILNIAPPLNIEKRWFAPHLPYTLAKYGMSFVTFALSDEFKRSNISVNSLWPKTAIATAAVNMLGGETMMQASRKPEIMADAAYEIFQQTEKPTGEFFIDEEVLAAAGVEDFDPYAVDPSKNLVPDFFI